MKSVFPASATTATKETAISRLETEVADVLSSLPGPARLLAAVSGGADSVALLVALARLNADIVVAHCNFHLRGDESDRDQRFVENLCRRLGVELKLIHFDVDEYRSLNGGSMEMACRELRYKWFEELTQSLRCRRILTAHHADDNVETMLLNMLRGCGLEGAKGMVADTGKIMRPLLRLGRHDITAYLTALGEKWIVDSTNLETEPDRNFLRLEVLPLLERRFPGAMRRMARTQRHLGDAFRIYEKWREMLRGDRLDLKDIESSVVRGTTIHEWVRPYGFNATQEAEMLHALGSGCPRKTRMWKSSDGKSVVLLETSGFRCVNAAVPKINIMQEPITLDTEWRSRIEANTDRFVAYFPKPLDQYLLRTLQPGDRMMIGTRSSKKLTDVFKEGGVPLHWRREWPLLVEDGMVIWVPGVRRSAYARIDVDTDKCYRFIATLTEINPYLTMI